MKGAPGGPAGQRAGRTEETTLRELMVRYQRAEPGAADELIRSLSPILYRYLGDPGQSKSDTEDLLQECWLRLHKSRHTYRSSDPVLPWVFAIARHTRVDGYRRRRRVQTHEIMMERLPENAQDLAPQRSEEDRFSRLIAVLPESQKDVLMMLKVSGMSLEEVARATSTTVGSVKQKAHRAYTKLRALLAERREHTRRDTHDL